MSVLNCYEYHKMGDVKSNPFDEKEGETLPVLQRARASPNMARQIRT